MFFTLISADSKKKLRENKLLVRCISSNIYIEDQNNSFENGD